MGQCVVVVSHPRSGTHFTIDFLRRNFAELRFLPPPWASAETLYFNLDRSGPRRAANGAWSRTAVARSSFIVKTHDLPFETALEPALKKAAGPRETVFLYPFRRMSKTLVSLRNFSDSARDLADFVEGADEYFETGGSVEGALIAHGEWALDHAHPIDIEAAIKEPGRLAAALAERFGWTRIAHENLLPPKRLATGRVGEIVERFRGRQSSEVAVKLPAASKEEAGWIDERPAISGLYERLKAAAL